jgi:cell division protein FtsQ
VAAIGAAVWWVLKSPLLSVSHIDVTGADRTPVLELLARAGVTPGVPLIDIDAGAAEAGIERSVWVIDATVSRDWPRGIAVTLTERSPLAWVRAGEKWHQVAKDGVSLGTRDSPPKGWPQIRVLGSETTSPVVIGALEFVAALPRDLRSGTRVIQEAGGLGAVVAGYEVRLGTAEDGVAKAKALAAVLATNPVKGSTITVVAPSHPAVLLPPSSTSAASS